MSALPEASQHMREPPRSGGRAHRRVPFLIRQRASRWKRTQTSRGEAEEAHLTRMNVFRATGSPSGEMDAPQEFTPVSGKGAAREFSTECATDRHGGNGKERHRGAGAGQRASGSTLLNAPGLGSTSSAQHERDVPTLVFSITVSPNLSAPSSPCFTRSTWEQERSESLKGISYARL